MPDTPLAAAVKHALGVAVRAVGAPELSSPEPEACGELEALLGALSHAEAEQLAVAAGYLARRAWAAYRVAGRSRTTGQVAPDGVSSVPNPRC